MKTSKLGWQSCTLDDIAEKVDYGHTASATDRPVGPRFLRITDIQNGRVHWDTVPFCECSAEDVRDSALAAGDIVFARTGATTGKSFLIDVIPEPAIFASYLIRLRLRSGYEPRLLAYYLQTEDYWSQIKQHSQGATLPGVNATKLRSLKVSLPKDEREQQRLADILDEASALRRRRAEAIQMANDLVPSIFYEMFGEVIQNDRAWDTSPLHKVAQLDRGRSRNRPRNAPELYGGPYPFVQTGDISNANGWIESYTQTYSEAGLAQSKLWPKGTLCITIAANIAATAVLTFDACFPASVVGLVPGDRLTTNYVRQWFVLKQRWLEEKAPQVAQKNINLEILNSLEITVPPKALLLDYERRVENWRVIQKKQDESQVELGNLFHSLLHRAFRGEL